MSNSDIFRVNAGNVSGYPFGLAVARGLVPGHSAIHKFGKVKPPNKNTLFDMWTGVTSSTPEYTFSTTATKMKISSYSSNDTSGGDGCHKVKVFGLDGDFKEISETVTLAGQTPVETTLEYIRVYRAYSAEAGDLGINEGDIYVYETGETSVIAGVPQTKTLIRAKIDEDRGQTEMAIYTVPAGKTAYIDELVTIVANRNARYTDIHLEMRSFNSNTFRRLFSSAFESAGTAVIKPTIPGVFEEKTDIKMITTTTQTSTSHIYGRFHLTLIDN